MADKSSRVAVARSN